MHENAQEPIEVAELEQTPLEVALWREATVAVLPGESPEDWRGEDDEQADGGNDGFNDGEGEKARLSAECESRAREAWRPWQWRFLSNLRQMSGVITLACRTSAVSLATVARYRERCKYFDRAVRDAMEGAIDRVEAALKVSATVGDIKPIYQGGILVGWERRKSDRAAEMLLRAKRPNEYRPESAQVSVQIDLPPQQLIGDAMKRLKAVTQVAEIEDVKQSGE